MLVIKKYVLSRDLQQNIATSKWYRNDARLNLVRAADKWEMIRNVTTARDTYNLTREDLQDHSSELEITIMHITRDASHRTSRRCFWLRLQATDVLISTLFYHLRPWDKKLWVDRTLAWNQEKGAESEGMRAKRQSYIGLTKVSFWVTSDLAKVSLSYLGLRTDRRYYSYVEC